jgi:hypothetical protein
MPVTNPAGGLTKWVESETLYSGKYYTKFAPTSTQTNKNVVASPLGTGGFSLQQADGTTAGGNARGDYSVDLQLARDSAVQVASGSYSFAQGLSCTASGFYSFVQGNSCTASGSYSFAHGISCTASGSYSLAQGTSCTASGSVTLAQGNGCVASSAYSVAQGNNCTASGSYALAQGNGCYTFIIGEKGIASGSFNVQGDAQRSELIIRANTTSATPVILTADQSAAGTTNQLVLRNDQSITAQVLVVAKKSGTTASTAHFKLTVCASRGANAASTVLHIEPVVETLWNPDGASIATTADTTNGGITFTVTTPAGNWHTVADVFAISTIYA